MIQLSGLAKIQPQVTAFGSTHTFTLEVINGRLAIEHILLKDTTLRDDRLIEKELASLLHLRNFARSRTPQRTDFERIIVSRET